MPEEAEPAPLDLGGIPAQLAGSVENAWHRVADSVSLPADNAWMASLPRVWAASEFVAQSCAARPELLQELVDNAAPQDNQLPGLAQRAAKLIDSAQDETQLLSALRQLRLREAVRLAWRDLSGAAQLDEVMATMSALAETCLQRSLRKLYEWYCRERGTPTGARSGAPVQLVVLGLGKLGGGELNFSSDIDLIFAYSEDGETDGAKPVSNHEFFTKLGRRLISVLEQPTAEGYCFRVDMRLRPNGDSGPLALSFDATEHYYQTHGRDWERYAWIKARPVAGDLEAGRRLLRGLRPFVYRKYLDYGAVNAISEMKHMIERELVRKGLADNIKLGRGGIREIEFVAQSFQLIRGGRDTRLQTNRLYSALSALVETGTLDAETVSRLRTAYEFLRNLEHRLQMVSDQQTHVLPGDETTRARVALGCRYQDWTALAEAVAQQRDRVHAIFTSVFMSRSGTTGKSAHPFADLWHNDPEPHSAQERLTEAGYADAAETFKHLHGLRHGRDYKALSSTGRERLDRLVPMLIEGAATTAHPDDTLQRLLRLLEAIGQRPNYLLLLIDSELARTQLIKLCTASAWIANWISRTPLLLDELLDPISAEAGTDPEQLEREMRDRLAGVDAQDLEFQMDTLRELRHAAVLRVAAADVSGLIDTVTVGRRLSAIAVVTLEQTVACAVANLAPRFGFINGSDGELPLSIVAYGKLGSEELGYHSDLDIVFLFPGDIKSGNTAGGERDISHEQYLSRLVQRVVHILTIRTSAGLLYDIDMRLRPSGRAGTLVTTVEAFTGYQAEHAWTWEHQALVRARPVTGPAFLRAAFEEVRRRVLCQPRDPQELAQDVRAMREKMTTAIDRSDEQWFDLKQGRGGMVDIEFLVQYYVLRWAHEFEQLIEPRSNLEILARLAELGVLDARRQQALAEAYQAYLTTDHRLKLAEQSALVPAEDLLQVRSAVQDIWQAELGEQ